MKTNGLTQMVEELGKAPKVALFSHVSPDGDCIGSMVALGLALEKMGKTVYFYNPDPVPQYLRFLPGVEKIQSTLPEPLPEAVLFVDCSDLARVNLDYNSFPPGTRILNLDHHVSNEAFGTVNWVNPEASASGEMAYQLIKKLPVKLDREIATNLYTAIVTDTGSFQYSNTTSQTHRLAAELMDVGIDIAKIHHEIYDQKPFAQVELLRRGLTRLKFYVNGKLAIMSLTKKDFEESGADESLSEGLVNHARTIQGVEVAILLKEVDTQRIRVSLRSNEWFNVNQTAARFGGGGHKRAAGCTLELSLAEAELELVQAIEEEIQLGRDH